MKLLNTLALLSLSLFSSSLLAANMYLSVSFNDRPVSNAEVVLDGDIIGKTDSQGYFVRDLLVGKHEVSLGRNDADLAAFTFTAVEDTDFEVQVTITGIGDPIINIQKYRVVEGEFGFASGVVTGESGSALENTKVSVLGREAQLSNSKGEFKIELPTGVHSIYFNHPEHGESLISKLRITANSDVDASVKLSRENKYDSLENVVAVAKFNAKPVSTVVIEKYATGVSDAIDIKDLLRFGDSSASAALKRIAGVTIADGKFAVVRGLNERHSSVILNSSSLPSTDPTRRVVPLDIFPATIIQNIEVNKTFTADAPADSTGGVVRVNTKKYPEQFEAEVSASLGYLSGLTGKDRVAQQDAGSLPATVADFEAVVAPSPAERQAAANSLPNNLRSINEKVDPDQSIEIGLGDTVIDDGEFTAGYRLSLKYDNEWSREDSERNRFNENLTKEDEFLNVRTSNHISEGLALVLGFEYGNSEVSFNTMKLGEETIESISLTGVGGDQQRVVDRTTHSVFDRDFTIHQLAGEHIFPSLLDTEVKWRISTSTAELDSPDQRTYSFESDDDGENFSLFLSSVDRVYTYLKDENDDFGLDLSSRLLSNDVWDIQVQYGYSTFSRERRAETNRFGYSTSTGGSALIGVTENNIDSVINQSSIASGAIALATETAASDAYDATWDVDALYLAADIDFGDAWSANIGFRSESSDLRVSTFNLGISLDQRNDLNSVVAGQDEDEVYPAVNVTYRPTEEWQLRAAFYETVNRPDFRELSNAVFIDVAENETFRGNPNLVNADVENFDVRAEYYFSDNESISAAYFTKSFDNPIEKTLTTGGSVFTFDNGETGTISGFEVDFRKEFDFDNISTFVSGNIALIDSEVEIIVDTVLKTQNMQGQPDNLMNLQLGLDEIAQGRKYTLVLNYQGETLHAVSERALPNIIREPRAELAFNFSHELENGFSYKFKAKNITDDKVELTQGGEVFRSFEKGAAYELGIAYKF